MPTSSSSSSSSSSSDLSSIQNLVWSGSIPLSIRLSPSESRAYNDLDPYLIHAPRLSYLPFLLSRLRAFFASALIEPDKSAAHDGWFSFEGVPLRWHYPTGLLYDLFSGVEATAEHARPGWELEVHFTAWPDGQLVRLDPEGRVMHDAFVNGVKEADFLRNGTAKGIMSLSREDSTNLWKAVQDHDLSLYNSVHQKLLNIPGTGLRHVPLRVYLPSSNPEDEDHETTPGKLRVVQSLVAPMISSSTCQISICDDMILTMIPRRGNTDDWHGAL
ncbi:MAG: autophagy protein 5 [Peltula sp. TS41687]|nr:MAG: autophagy protein 5 [Peltula sp. TS41687]